MTDTTPYKVKSTPEQQMKFWGIIAFVALLILAPLAYNVATEYMGGNFVSECVDGNRIEARIPDGYSSTAEFREAEPEKARGWDYKVKQGACDNVSNSL